MLKKAIPLFLLSGLVLGGCNTTGTIPKKNETPMGDVIERDRNWTPNVRDEQRGGTNLDGIDNGPDVNGTRNGVINDNNTNGVINEGTGTTPNGVIIEEDLNTNTNRMNR